MSTTDLIGSEHNAHLDWLQNNWMDGNSPVCFLEGFPGTGKTTIARALLSRLIAAKLTAVMVTVPATEKDPTDDLLLDLATELNSAGRTELARAIDNNRPLLDVLSSIVEEPILIIIDEFQNSMQGERAITLGGFAKVLSTLANRKWLKGRVLLLTNRLVERASWSEPYAIRTLTGMSSEDGVELLEHFAQEGEKIDEITPERRQDVVKWLGGNPRAIQLLVRSLSYESLDDLIGIQPELWEMRDREVSIELVEKLERGLLERTLSQIPNDYLRQLYRLSVCRKPFKREAIERLFNDMSTYARFREEMINRFLMEQHRGWFNLHPIAREIGLQKLAQSPFDLKQAHSIIATYYTRHFEAKQIVGWGALGGHFVEARYHLVKAEKADDLKDIASRFQSYIFSTLSSSSSIPHSAEELDERIAVLSALLETPGPKNLEYHLARLFKVRNQRNDLRRALHHVRRAKSNSDIPTPWLLCGEILCQMGRNEEAIEVLVEGINKIPVDNDVKALYTSCSQIMVQQGRQQEAIALLKQGINKIPVNNDVKALYTSCSQIMVQQGQHREAIALLKQGIDKIPVNNDVRALYTSCSQIMAQQGQQREAIALLEQGINGIPVDKDVRMLYISCSQLLIQEEQQEEAVTLLIQGITRIPAKSGRLPLIQHILMIYVSKHDNQAISRLIQNIKDIQPLEEAILQTLYYQSQERWLEAAEYAERKRKGGIESSLLHISEIFAWLCAGNPDKALEVIEIVDVRDNYFQKQKYWLLAFANMRLGNIDEARQALMLYDDQIPSSQNIDVAFLLSLWRKPAKNLSQYHLAHYFPTLPSVLMDWPQSVASSYYEASTQIGTVKPASSLPNQLVQKRENMMQNNSILGAEATTEDYIDFDLHIAPDGHVIASSPEGQATSHISTQPPSSLRLALQLIERRQTDVDLLKEVGSSLYDWIFPNSIHTHLQQTEAVARRGKAKLRLRLRVEAASIASLPLEFIFRKAGGYFLAVNPDTVFSRYLNLPMPPEQVRRRKGTLHMLVIVADPIDRVRLDPDEWETIVKEALHRPLASGQMTLQTVKRANRREIRDALLAQKPDIVQFVGHGAYKNGKGYLALVEESTNKAWLVDDERFANLFMGYDDHLGLISMATCESAQSDDPQGFLGISTQLVQRGIPAVVAMQYEVYIKTAKVFMEDFYTSVTNHKPIDWAVQSARNAISLEFGLDNREFATPVIYMRARDGNVFS